MKNQHPEIQLDEVFNTFLNEYKEKLATYYNYKASLKKWIEFTKMNGKESLEFKKRDSDAKTEKLVMKFRTYLKEKGASDNAVKSNCSAIRSFYMNQRLPLQFIEAEKRKMNEVQRATTDYKFSKDDIAKMLVDANLQDKWILIAGKDFGLRASDFLGLTFGQLRQLHLDEEPPLAFPIVHTKKVRGVDAYPFVSSDLVPIIKEILARNPQAKNEDRILSFADEQPLTLTIKRLFKRANLEAGNSVVRFHELRAYLATRLSSVAAESQWKQIIGKSIDEGAYVTQEELREVYKRAMPLIVINGNSKNHAQIEKLEEALIEAQKQLANQETINQELRKKLETVSSDNAENRSKLFALSSETTELIDFVKKHRHTLEALAKNENLAKEVMKE